MTRVLTCLGMVSVLLLTSFVTNVYAAEDFPTYNEVKITVSGIPGQTGESVTDVDLTPSPCSAQNDTTCTGFSDITIPGIGVGHLLVIFHNHKATATHPPILAPVILFFISAALLFLTNCTFSRRSKHVRRWTGTASHRSNYNPSWNWSGNNPTILKIYDMVLASDRLISGSRTTPKWCTQWVVAYIWIFRRIYSWYWYDEAIDNMLQRC